MSHSSEIRVAVSGAGSWGVTVAPPASVNTPTTCWARRDAPVEQISPIRGNADDLPSFTRHHAGDPLASPTTRPDKRELG
jgi:glycerol-3-phosphate dehydrogenase